jgi:hypothetical protein
MGLIALPEAEWFEIDERFAAQLAEKRRLLAERHDAVFRSLPGSEPAQAELRDAMFEHLPRVHPDHFHCDGDDLALPALGETWRRDDAGLAPLDLAARLVQEDLCLMQPDAAGDWRLTAASVCFPTRWRLAEKIGRRLDAIHDPVPGLNERLASPMARFFDRLQPGRGVWRLNWSVIDSPALHQPGGHFRTAPADGLAPQTIGERTWLRVERQTLRRLPLSIVFTIRIHVWPLSALAERPEAAGRMAAAIDTMPAALRRYKSLGVFGDALTGYLRRLAAHGTVTDK